jgi:hypothetical protein
MAIIIIAILTISLIYSGIANVASGILVMRFVFHFELIPRCGF